MGTQFRYLADEIAETAAVGTCEACSSTNARLFPIHAALDDDEWSLGCHYVEELCQSCLASIPLRKLAPRESERMAQQLINGFYKKGTISQIERQFRLVVVCEGLRRTPSMPLFLQDEDWPFCCGDYCEFIGRPENYVESIALGEEGQYWSRGPESYEEHYGDMTLEPESLREVSKFRCLTCPRESYTWQMT